MMIILETPTLCSSHKNLLYWITICFANDPNSDEQLSILYTPRNKKKMNYELLILLIAPKPMHQHGWWRRQRHRPSKNVRAAVYFNRKINATLKLRNRRQRGKAAQPDDRPQLAESSAPKMVYVCVCVSYSGQVLEWSCNYD